MEDRYSVAAETRNNLVAASQNIQGAQRYLSNIQFPYCAPSEVETLNKATAYIFTDMQTKGQLISKADLKNFIWTKNDSPKTNEIIFVFLP